MSLYSDSSQGPLAGCHTKFIHYAIKYVSDQCQNNE